MIEHVCVLWVAIGLDCGHDGIPYCWIWFWGPLCEVNVWSMGGNGVEVLVSMIIDWPLVTDITVNKRKIANNKNKNKNPMRNAMWGNGGQWKKINKTKNIP